jgi:uncharacterized HAD superfamily protein
MKIAIDLDNTITASRESIEFFGILTRLLCQEHKIYILTDGEPETEQLIAEELDDLEIDYSEIIITSNKAQFIKENNINVFYEDTDDYFLELGPEVTVFKVRGETNFSFAAKKWYGLTDE